MYRFANPKPTVPLILGSKHTGRSGWQHNSTLNYDLDMLQSTTGELSFAEKEVSTVGCTYQFTASQSHMNMSSSHVVATTPLSDGMRSTAASEGFQIYHISYIWYTLVGSSICIIVSLVASYVTGPNVPCELNPQLLAPFVRKLIKRRATSSTTSGKQTPLTTSNNTTRNMTETSFQVKEELK